MEYEYETLLVEIGHLKIQVDSLRYQLDSTLDEIAHLESELREMSR